MNDDDEGIGMVTPESLYINRSLSRQDYLIVRITLSQETHSARNTERVSISLGSANDRACCGTFKGKHSVADVLRTVPLTMVNP
jgi:hypothetical protein